MKTHDADLCERIRELEKRVEELETRPSHYCGHYCNHWPTITYPQWTYTPWVSGGTGNTYTIDSNTTSNIVYSDIQPN